MISSTLRATSLFTLKFALFALFGTAFILPALLIYWYKEPPPVVYSQRRVLTPVVPPGGELQIRISADVTKKCNATVYRSVVDSSSVQTQYAPVFRPLETDYTVRVTIPLGAAPGPAFYSARVQWKCNFVQQWFPQEVIQRNIYFEIAPSEGQLPMPSRQGVYQAPEQKSELATTNR
jgi:hypothetical protein